MKSRSSRGLPAIALWAAILIPSWPVWQTAHADEPPALHYVTRAGDTLIGLGKRYLADPDAWHEVQRINRIANPRRILPGTRLRIPADLLRATPGQVTAVQVDGDVQWHASHDAPWQTLQTGSVLQGAAVLRTGEQASVTLRLRNGTEVVLLPQSEMGLDRLLEYADGAMSDSRLKLLRGQTRILDNPQRQPNQNLRIITPGAQAVVRGTTFRVGYAEGATREGTLDGQVSLAAGGSEVLVAQGYGSLSPDGQPPLPPVRLLAAPELNALPERFERLPLRLAWPAQTGAQRWVAQVTPANQPGHILARKTVVTPTLAVADLPDGSYALGVSALDAQGLQGYAATRGFQVSARPFPPLLQTPGNKAVVRQPRPAFSWSPVRDVPDARLQICTREDCGAPLWNVTQAAHTWTPPTDLPAGQLFWRMASIDASGHQGPWSDVGRFTYKPAPGPVDLGQSAITFTPDAVQVSLPPPPDEQHYALKFLPAGDSMRGQASITSMDGRATFARPNGGNYTLAVSLVDNADSTEGPAAVRKIEVPARYPGLWILLIPLLPAL